MTTKFTWMKPLPPQRFPVDPTMPVVKVNGVGPGYASVVFSAVPLYTANDPKYVVGEK